MRKILVVTLALFVALATAALACAAEKTTRVENGVRITILKQARQHCKNKKARKKKTVKKKIAKKKKLPATVTAPPATCVEIRLPKMLQGDLGVKGVITGPGGHDIAKDSCISLVVDGKEQVLPNEICAATLPVFCNFARQEALNNQPGQLKFSFFTKPGVTYALRLPSFMATDEKYTTFVNLVRSLLTKKPGTTEAFRETVEYGKTNLAMMGIPSSCYESGVTTLYYAERDIPATAGCQLYLFVPRSDWRGP